MCQLRTPTSFLHISFLFAYAAFIIKTSANCEYLSSEPEKPASLADMSGAELQIRRAT